MIVIEKLHQNRTCEGLKTKEEKQSKVQLFLLDFWIIIHPKDVKQH